MPNSTLKGRYFTPSDEALAAIEKAVMKYDIESGDKGFARAKKILHDKRINYGQMKRIKNYFDTYEGDGTDTEYKIIGGKTMMDWVNNALEVNRDYVHDEKQARMDAGDENQFIKTHEKDKDNANPTGVGMVKIHKGSKMRNIMQNDTIYEEMDTIKYLMRYMDNKE